MQRDELMNCFDRIQEEKKADNAHTDEEYRKEINNTICTRVLHAHCLYSQ